MVRVRSDWLVVILYPCNVGSSLSTIRYTTLIATKEGKDQISTDTGNLSDIDLLYGLRNKNESLYLRQRGRVWIVDCSKPSGQVR